MPRYSHVAVARPSRCTVELIGGRFCDAEQAPDMPFAICARHAIQIYRRMHDIVAEVQGKHDEYPELYDATVREAAEQRYAKANVGHTVYYVQVGDLIKVGTTRQVERRIAQYPPDARLLATEPGGEHLENKRLVQFRHLLAHRKEWFHPGEDLMAHIATLTAKDRP